MFLSRNLDCVLDKKNPFVSTIYCLHNTGFQFVTNFVLSYYFKDGKMREERDFNLGVCK